MIQRPWVRIRKPDTDKVFVMARRNYKVYAGLGGSHSVIQRTLTILDTGAGPNFIREQELPEHVVGRLRAGPLPEICDANNRPLNMLGTVNLVVQLGTFVVRDVFIVCRTLAAPAILGADFCDKYVEAIRPKKRHVELDDGTTVPIVRGVLRRVAPEKNSDVAKEEKKTKTDPSTAIKVSQPVTIQPGTQTGVEVTCNQHGLIVLQPIARLFENHRLSAANGVASVEPGTPFTIFVANLGKVPKRLGKGQIVASALRHPTKLVTSNIMVAEFLGLTKDEDEQDDQPKGESPTQDNHLVGGNPTEETEIKHQTGEDEKNKSKSDSWTEDQPTAADLDLSHLPKDQQERLRKVLLKHDGIWSGHLGLINTVTHTIPLEEGAQPQHQRPYRNGPPGRKFIGNEVGRLEGADLIEPSSSPWASPVVLAPKADGSYRFCVDYRRLNAVTIRDTYPLPRMDDCIDSLGEAKIFSTLDANWGYWQIPIAEEDRDKTTFTSHVGTYRWKRMPFGLMNAPSTFQRALDMILSAYNWQTCLVYLDDIIIFSKDYESHLEAVDKILETLKQAGISLKLKKCTWCTDSVKYLGHIIKPGELHVNDVRTKSLREMQHPTTQTELRSFLGLINVYRRFIPHFSHIASPLNQLLKKGSPKKLEPLNDEQAEAFQKLIDAVLQPPVLALPKPDLPYSIDTDASDYQVGAALFQEYGDKERKPIGFWSRTLLPAEKNYSTSEKECLAVVWAMQTLRPYVQGTHFTVNTDHSALRWLMEICEPSGRLMRWRLRLSEFDFNIVHKKGLINTQADAMSRLTTLGSTTVDIDDDIPQYPHTTSTTSTSDIPNLEDPSTSLEDFDEQEDTATVLLAEEKLDDNLAAPITTEELKREQAADPFCQRHADCLAGGRPAPGYGISSEGVLFRHKMGCEQIVVPKALQPRVLHLAHHSKLAGHPGGNRLYKYLRRSFFWKSMAFDCYLTVKNCTDCAKNRIFLRTRQKKMRLFPAKAPLESVAIDILGELVKTPRGHKYLLVISDRFSKLVRTIPLKNISANTVAQAFVTHWVMPYGPPTHLVSDNGSQFTSKFFQHVCQLLGIRNLFTTTYHPQTNGQVERFNRTILAAIRSYTAEFPKEWDLYTDTITFAYNTYPHSTTGCPPFELVLSRPPSTLIIEQQPHRLRAEKPKEFRDRWVMWLKCLVADAKVASKGEQVRQKRNFDQHVRPVEQQLKAGVLVYVKKEGYTKAETRHKLASVVEGPFMVLGVGEDTVLVRRDVDDERISRDRIVLAPGGREDDDEPEERVRPEAEDTETAIVDKLVDHGFVEGEPVYRVRWYGYDESEDTWEPPHHLRRNHLLRYFRNNDLVAPPGVLEQAMPE